MSAMRADADNPESAPSMQRWDAPAEARDEPADSECEDYVLRARQAGTEAPYQVAADIGDAYRCFV